MTSKKVSIIIPCYNQEQYVAEAIESAINQSYKNIEIIIIDDCSCDNSYDVINKYKNFSFIKIIKNETNNGVIYSRNKAILEFSTGEYILPLDADDTIEPTYVEKAVEVISKNPQIGLVYSRVKFFGSKNEEWILPDFNEDKFLYANCIFNSALYRKSDFIKLGGYKEYMKDGYEDWDFWISFIENGHKPYKINEILYNYRQQNTTTRNDLVGKNIINLYRTLLKNHINFYLKNDNFINKIFFPNPKINEKCKKYRKLTKLFIIFSTLELFIIFLLIYMLIK